LRALAAWTLLELGVPADDPVVKRLVGGVRQDSVRRDYLATYHLSLAILLFEKLGDPRDVPLIHSAAVRLLAGQNAHGGWTYRGPAVISPAEGTRLVQYLREQDYTKSSKYLQKPAPAPEIGRQVKDILSATPPDRSFGDNSNTQFGIMGLWAARRHGIPVRRALDWSEQRFTASQLEGGQWSYVPPDAPAPTPAYRQPNWTATCIALYAIATNAALKSAPGKRVDLLTNPAIRRGFDSLAPTLEVYEATHSGERICYYLYALEKTAEVFDVREIGGKDWYRLGATWLVKTQHVDGGWLGPRGKDASREIHIATPVDTCFALLFLKRVNPAPDLALNLHGIPTPSPDAKLQTPLSDAHALDLPTAIIDPMKKKSP
jgi:hypothetical protein